MNSLEFLKHVADIESYLRKLAGRPAGREKFSELLRDLAARNVLSPATVQELLIIWEIRNEAVNSPTGYLINTMAPERLQAIRTSLGI